jgi:hypothetical protein
MDEPQDSSMAATKIQRNRDICVVAGVTIDPFLSGLEDQRGDCTVIGKIDSSRVFWSLPISSSSGIAKIGESGEPAAVLEGRLRTVQGFAAVADSQLFEILATLGNRSRSASQSWRIRQNTQTHDEESATQRVLVVE